MQNKKIETRRNIFYLSSNFTKYFQTFKRLQKFEHKKIFY